MPKSRSTGLAMLDVLVALLLLAVTLTGASATLLQAMRSTHGALLASRAVDLAADLTEELQHVSAGAGTDALLAQWRARVAIVLPVSGMDEQRFASLVSLPAELAVPGRLAASHELTLRWWHAPGELRELRLPVMAAHP